MDETARKRLARRVRNSRIQKFGTVDKARIAAGISRGAWDSVEQGKPVRDFTLGAVEKALDWPPGQAAAVLEERLGDFGVEPWSDDPNARVVDLPGSPHSPARLVLLDKDGLPVPESDQDRYAEAVRELLRTRPDSLISILRMAAEAVEAVQPSEGGDGNAEEPRGSAPTNADDYELAADEDAVTIEAEQEAPDTP